MLAEVGFPNSLVGEHLSRCARCDHMSFAYDVSAFANIQSFTHIVVRDQYANVTGFKMGNDIFDIRDGDGIDACKRFIKEKKLGR